MMDCVNAFRVLEKIFGDSIIYRIIQYIRFLIVGSVSSELLNKIDPVNFLETLRIYN